MIPLEYQQLRVGILCLYSVQNNLKWAEKNKALVRHLITQSTLLIQQKQQLIKEKSYQKLIRSINQQINSDQLTPKVLEDILQKVAETFEIEQILLLEIPNLQTLCCPALKTHPHGKLLSNSKKINNGRFISHYLNLQKAR